MLVLDMNEKLMLEFAMLVLRTTCSMVWEDADLYAEEQMLCFLLEKIAMEQLLDVSSVK